MLVDRLKLIRERTIDGFCAVMEFKAFTDLAYIKASQYAKELPTQEPYVIGYSDFAPSLGLPDKVVSPNEFLGFLEKAKETHLFPFVHQHQFTLFELLFFDILHVVLSHHPQHLPSG
ncbi:MAG: hypothetical protein SVY15_05310 [Halobacteriota archaeon]|nr:hypothetical protein [Halobacteriota archaeon]